jgi:hypothetical protein
VALVLVERATLADWVGRVDWWVAPLAELIGKHVLQTPRHPYRRYADRSASDLLPVSWTVLSWKILI